MDHEMPDEAAAPEAAPIPVSGAVPLGELEPVPSVRGRRRTWVAPVVVLIVVAVVIGALVIGRGSDARSAVLVLRDAPARTTDAASARIESIETLTIDGRTRPVIDIAGASDYRHKAVSLTLSGAGGTVEEIRVVAGVTYVSSALADLPDGAHWVSVTPADVKIDSNARNALGSSDPGSGLQFMSAVKGDPRVVGHARLAGVGVTHYTFRLDLKNFIERQSQATERLGVSGLVASLRKLESLVDLTRVPGEAWIDVDGRVRRFDFSISVSQGGQSVKIANSVRFSHFDEPVRVEPPPASDTVPFRRAPSFFSDLAAAGGSASAA